MKLASFRTAAGATYGLVTDHGLVDAGARLGRRWPTLRDALAAPEGLSTLAALSAEPATHALDAVTYLPVITQPEKVICVGVNYHAHRLETGRDEMPYPTLFSRFSNTLVGHGAPLVSPRVSTQLDFEAEMALVIGARARHLKAEDALSAVAGFTCFQDATVRDWQRHTTQFTPGKNFVSTAGLGPYMVTRDAFGDPRDAEVVMRLNGVEMQRATTDLLIFDVGRLLAYITAFTELVPGDIVATGTPGGVGSKRTPPVFLKPGDVCEVEVRGVGVLRNPVAAEAP
ncbi:MAG: fumarylacetoacetate hydrolase family protein [Myxococcales bacterium]|nr:fumarylacetoacetate hydrolase family protein [Myxococcales bacterium]